MKTCVAFMIGFLLLSSAAFAGEVGGNVTNTVEAETVTAVAIGEDATAAAGAVIVEGEVSGDVTNSVEAETVTAVAIGEGATAAAGAVIVK